jgi:hypothetical protein
MPNPGIPVSPGGIGKIKGSARRAIIKQKPRSAVTARISFRVRE